jgi:hypothetical protein
LDPNGWALAQGIPKGQRVPLFACNPAHNLAAVAYVSGQDEAVPVVLQPGVGVSVSLKDEDGAPIPDYQVTVRGATPMLEAYTDEHGRATLQPLPPDLPAVGPRLGAGEQRRYTEKRRASQLRRYKRAAATT